MDHAKPYLKQQTTINRKVLNITPNNACQEPRMGLHKWSERLT